MGDLDLLPAPFPIEELLDEQDLRHVKRLYGIGGLSYGNLSARKDDTRFWMSASGVDKTKLDIPGPGHPARLGLRPGDNKMILSVPPNVEPRRVSVDAIEHWMIYQAHPDVGAILHVHAWMEGIPATDINYPCGTAELATSVAELLAREPDPSHAVIGLRNHGITATGREPAPRSSTGSSRRCCARSRCRRSSTGRTCPACRRSGTGPRSLRASRRAAGR